MQNKLAALGARIITEHDAPVHVSGHPARDELLRMYQTVRPRIAVPVHGETRHLMAQARLAGECQVPQTVVTRNGEMVKLAPGPAAVIGEVPVGRLVIDGTQLIAASSEALKARSRMVSNGTALASLVLDRAGKLVAAPQVTVQGVEAGEAAALGPRLGARIAEALDELSPKERRDDDAVREAARLALRRSVRAWHGKRPVIEIHLVRI
ncbi:MAG: MBL fold metallo-hydrolase RNA specificity domain-containing protein [Stellaceae bacterium]